MEAVAQAMPGGVADVSHLFDLMCHGRSFLKLRAQARAGREAARASARRIWGKEEGNDEPSGSRVRSAERVGCASGEIGVVRIDFVRIRLRVGIHRSKR
ncbi:hypothetical protein D3C71_1779370 [compost metagenome]